MSNLVRMLKACVVVFSTNAKRLFELKFGYLKVQLSVTAGSAREVKS